MRRSSLLACVVLAACGGGAARTAGPRKVGHEHPSGHAQKAWHEHGEGHGHVHGTAHHRFDDPERWAKELDDPGRDEWQKPAEVVALLELAPGMVVADLGTGTGYFLPHLSRAVGTEGKVLALDVEPKMVDYVRARAKKGGLANVRAEVVPEDAPGLAEGSVDRVLVVDTWHHIGSREAYGKKLFAALKPGGRVFVVDFTLESPKGPPPKHKIPAEQVVRELETAGFSASIATETLPDQYVVVGRRP